MELQQAQNISQEIIKKLSPYCSRIEVAGSIRRRSVSGKRRMIKDQHSGDMGKNERENKRGD